MKGTKISIVFPNSIYSFLNDLTSKMNNIPLLDPKTNKPFIHPETGRPLTMSHTGKIEELIHGSILTSIIPLLQQHPAFKEELAKLPLFVKDYGNYIQTLGGVNNNSQKS